jgi:hypothetical protein
MGADSRNVSFEGLPDADLVERGSADLEHGRETIEALLVSIGATRLRAVGIHLKSRVASSELKLYGALAAEDSDSAHSRYNALIRRLVSFESAAEREHWSRIS